MKKLKTIIIILILILLFISVEYELKYINKSKPILILAVHTETLKNISALISTGIKSSLPAVNKSNMNAIDYTLQSNQSFTSQSVTSLITALTEPIAIADNIDEKDMKDMKEIIPYDIPDFSYPFYIYGSSIDIPYHYYGPPIIITPPLPVPEPSSFALIAIALLTIGYKLRK